MRKIILFIAIFALFSPINSSAQSWLKNRTVGAVEVELGVGLATAANNISHFGKTRAGVDVNAEVRYNFSKVPVDLGLYFSLCTFKRGVQIGDTAKSYNFDSQNLLVTSDYNLFQGRLASLFVGAGAGVAWSSLTMDSSRYGFNFCVMPRVGVELSQHIRITAAYKFYEKANNHLVISLGYAFGGGKR